MIKLNKDTSYFDCAIVGYLSDPQDSDSNLSYFNELVLHEVGHAIGFEHEHQSPEGKCEQEFDWPKVYEFARTEWGWVTPKGEVDKQIVDVNMRALSSAERLRITPYDRGSIMHYYFEPELFKRGRNSHCFVGHNKVLSRTDRELAREAYPPEVTMQDGHLQKRADVASAILAPMKLTAPQLSRVGREVGRVLAAAPRKVTLDFDLARGAGKPSTRGGGGDPLEPCGSADQLSDAKMDVACGVAADASVLVVAVEPK